MSISPVKITFKNGTTLFRQDDSIRHVYLIDSGQVLLKVKAGGQDVSLLSVGKGELLGEHVVFGERNYKMTAIADSEVSAYVMSTDDLNELFKQIPRPLQLMLGSSIKKAANLLEDHKQRLQNLSHLKAFSNYGQLLSFYLLILQDFNYGGMIRMNEIKQSALSLFNMPSTVTEKVMLALHKQHLIELIQPTEIEPNQFIQLGDLTPLIHFIDYFRKYFLSAENSFYFEVNDHLIKVINSFLHEGSNVLARNGFIEISFSKVFNQIKLDYGFNLSDFHFNYLNRLGVFIEKKGIENNSMILIISLEDLIRLKSFWGLLESLHEVKI